MVKDDPYLRRLKHPKDDFRTKFIPGKTEKIQHVTLNAGATKAFVHKSEWRRYIPLKGYLKNEDYDERAMVGPLEIDRISPPRTWYYNGLNKFVAEGNHPANDPSFRGHGNDEPFVMGRTVFMMYPHRFAHPGYSKGIDLDTLKEFPYLEKPLSKTFTGKYTIQMVGGIKKIQLAPMYHDKVITPMIEVITITYEDDNELRQKTRMVSADAKEMLDNVIKELIDQGLYKDHRNLLERMHDKKHHKDVIDDEFEKYYGTNKKVEMTDGTFEMHTNIPDPEDLYKRRRSISKAKPRRQKCKCSYIKRSKILNKKVSRRIRGKTYGKKKKKISAR